jgi:two-component system, chemotaxis family, sensor kinase Cph1
MTALIEAVPDEAPLERRVRELERANRELIEVAHLTAHDLKEPLCAIALLAEMVSAEQADNLDEQGRRLVESIRDGALRMHTTVDETLALVCGDRREHGPVDMGEVVDLALRNLRARPETSTVQVRVDPLPEIVGDRTQLIRLMQNLLCNAMKFSADAPRPRVSVSARETRAGWLFEVRDNGIGAVPPTPDWLFDPFQCRDPEDSRSGAGLGLTIARQVVESHGGSISIESVPQGGALVRFTLPHALPEAADEPERSRPAPPVRRALSYAS